MQIYCSLFIVTSCFLNLSQSFIFSDNSKMLTIANRGGKKLNLFKSKLICRAQEKLKMLQETDGFSEAFVGGTVGVMAMAFLVEARKLQDQSLEGCPYCMGNGEILCGECLGLGNLKANSSNEKCMCGSCRGRGLVICINCKGDGRNMPIILQSKATRDPEYATKDRLNEFDLDSP